MPPESQVNGLRPLSLGEVLGLLGDREVELAQYRRYVAELEARILELEAEPAPPVESEP